MSTALAPIDPQEGLQSLLLTLVEPVPASGEPVDPGPVKLTQAQLEAVAALPAVFGKIAPDTRRRLSPEEAGALAYEREVLDVVAKAIEVRREAQRRAVFAHLDVEAEANGAARPDTTPRHPKDGFYLVAGEIPLTGRRWTREISDRTKPGVDVTVLAREATREDFLAMTEAVRVVCPAKVLAAVARKPALMEVIRKATVLSGSKVASLYLRKAR